MFDNTASELKPIEFMRLNRELYIAEIGIVEGDLIFHFYKTGDLIWPHDRIDILFKEVFQGDVKDLTGEFENKMREIVKRRRNGEKIPTTFMIDIYKEVTNHPSKIHRTFTPMTNSWTYSVKGANSPFIDVMAKRIIEGLDELVRPS